MRIEKLAVTVPLATTGELWRGNVEDFEEIALTIKNNGPNAFDAFEIRGKTHLDAAEVPIATIAGDFSTPLFPMRRSIGTPVSLASGASAMIFMNVAGLSELSVWASAATNAGTADVHGKAYVS